MIWLAVRAFLRAVPAWVWVALLAVGAVLGYGHLRYNAGQADTQAKWDQSEARHAAQAARQAIEARKTEARHRADYAAAVARLRDQQRIADAKHADLVAGLRAGSVRLRERFRCPTPSVPGAPADTGGTDGTGPRGFGPEDATTAFGIAERADAVARRLNELQEAVRAGQR